MIVGLAQSSVAAQFLFRKAKQQLPNTFFASEPAGRLLSKRPDNSGRTQ
ncbi:hypothetical protein FHS26_006760 [Rhizobium pisi]|uniref:Uncharacterized protein n=1 Tax=Rhizobium pisi TaxID=574561 RepID=A0A7W5G3J8_9HYPH|nr:hypothetical protein [Rhizobium pisi]